MPKVPVCAKWHFGKRPWFMQPLGLNEKQSFDIFLHPLPDIPTYTTHLFPEIAKVDLFAIYEFDRL